MIVYRRRADKVNQALEALKIKSSLTFQKVNNRRAENLFNNLEIKRDQTQCLLIAKNQKILFQRSVQAIDTLIRRRPSNAKALIAT